METSDITLIDSVSNQGLPERSIQTTQSSPSTTPTEDNHQNVNNNSQEVNLLLSFEELMDCFPFTAHNAEPTFAQRAENSYAVSIVLHNYYQTSSVSCK